MYAERKGSWEIEWLKGILSITCKIEAVKVEATSLNEIQWFLYTGY